MYVRLRNAANAAAPPLAIRSTESSADHWQGTTCAEQCMRDAFAAEWLWRGCERYLFFDPRHTDMCSLRIHACSRVELSAAFGSRVKLQVILLACTIGLF